MRTHSKPPGFRAIAKAALQFCAFQGAWFACVLGAAHGRATAGTCAALAVVLLTWLASERRAVDAALTAQAVLMGFAWDSAMLRLGWVLYASPSPFGLWAPGWILALWALFATLVRGPLSWMHGRPLLAAAFGAVGGPLSYLAAVRLGAGSFADQKIALGALAAGWAVMTPALTQAACWLEKHGPPKQR